MDIRKVKTLACKFVHIVSVAVYAGSLAWVVVLVLKPSLIASHSSASFYVPVIFVLLATVMSSIITFFGINSGFRKNVWNMIELVSYFSLVYLFFSQGAFVFGGAFLIIYFFVALPPSFFRIWLRSANR